MKRVRPEAAATPKGVMLTLDPHLTGADYFAEYHKVRWCTVRQAARWVDIYVLGNTQSPIWDALRGLEFVACCAGFCRQILPHCYLVDESCAEDLANYLELSGGIISYKVKLPSGSHT